MLEKLKKIVDKQSEKVENYTTYRNALFAKISLMVEHNFKREAEYLTMEEQFIRNLYFDYKEGISEIQKTIEEIKTEQSKQPAEAESEGRNGIFNHMILLGKPKTIGELRALIAGYHNDTSFGFFNQPMQDLYIIDNTYIVFKEGRCNEF